MGTTDQDKLSQSTAGELLPDGCRLELIRDASRPGQMALMLWDGRQAQVGEEIEYRGRTYVPIALAGNTIKALSFATGRTNYGSLEEIFVRLDRALQKFFDLPDRDRRLLVHWILSTWVVDALPVGVTLLVSGSSEVEVSRLLRFLKCVCRHSVRLGDISRPGLIAMPWQLQPTFVIEGLALNRSTRALLKISSSRGLYTARSGDFYDLNCAKAISLDKNSVDESVIGCMLRVTLPPQSRTRILNATDEEEIGAEFQPILLDYRLRNYEAVRASMFDAPQFTPEIRELARSLGAAVAANPQLAAGVIPLLGPDQERSRARRSVQLEFVLVTVLLALVHDPDVKEMRVTEITKFVNAALFSNGEILEYTPKKIGWRLDGMGLYTCPVAKGNGFRFDREFSRAVHTLARAMGVTTTPAPYPGCRDCEQPPQLAEAKSFA